GRVWKEFDWRLRRPRNSCPLYREPRMAFRDDGPRSPWGDGGQHREVRASIPLPLSHISASPDRDGGRAPAHGTFSVGSEDRRRIRPAAAASGASIMLEAL